MKQISFFLRWKLLAGLLGAGSAGIALVDNRIREDIKVNFQAEKLTRFR